MNSLHADTDSHVIALIRSHQMLEADPQNATAHFEQGIALCQLGQPAEAIAAWTQAVTLEPTNAFAYINIGIAHLELEQWSQAEQAFRKAVELQPEQAEAHYGLGMVYARQGRHEAAQMAWQETLRLAPEHAESRANLTTLMEMRAQQEVFSINLGPAQTLQMECGVLPEQQSYDLFSAQHAVASNVLSASVLKQASDSQEVDSQEVPDTQTTQELPLEKAQLSTERPRIKLPELKGPPLESIADVVLAAHDAHVLAASLPDTEAFSHGQTLSLASGQEQDTPEPTLEFDSEDLKKEHSRLRRRQEAAPSSPTRRNMAAAAGAVFVIILLACWNLQSRRLQSALPSSSVSPDTSLTRASTNLTAPYSNQASPAPQHDPGAVKQVEPVLPTPGVVLPPRSDLHQSLRLGGIGSNPHVVRPPRSDLHARPAEQVSHPGRGTPANVEAAAPRAAHRRILPPARSVRAGRVHPAKSRHDEDTFSAHAHAASDGADDEWTDHIPK